MFKEVHEPQHLQTAHCLKKTQTKPLDPKNPPKTNNE